MIGEQEIRGAASSRVELTRAWPPRSVDESRVEHSAPLFALAPEVVVLSTGAKQKFPRAALRAEFATRRIGLEVMEIGAACRTYNVLVGEERRVLGGGIVAGSPEGTRVKTQGEKVV